MSLATRLSQAAEERDARDLAAANTLVDLADLLMENGCFESAVMLWEVADAFGAGLTIDDILRRVYSGPEFVAAATAAIEFMAASPLHDDDYIVRANEP